MFQRSPGVSHGPRYLLQILEFRAPKLLCWPGPTCSNVTIINYNHQAVGRDEVVIPGHSSCDDRLNMTNMTSSCVKPGGC